MLGLCSVITCRPWISSAARSDTARAFIGYGAERALRLHPLCNMPDT